MPAPPAAAAAVESPARAPSPPSRFARAHHSPASPPGKCPPTPQTSVYYSNPPAPPTCVARTSLNTERVSSTACVFAGNAASAAERTTTVIAPTGTATALWALIGKHPLPARNDRIQPDRLDATDIIHIPVHRVPRLQRPIQHPRQAHTELLDRRQRRIPVRPFLIHHILLIGQRLPRRKQRRHLCLMQRERESADRQPRIIITPDRVRLLPALVDGLPSFVRHNRRFLIGWCCFVFVPRKMKPTPAGQRPRGVGTPLNIIYPPPAAFRQIPASF